MPGQKPIIGQTVHRSISVRSESYDESARTVEIVYSSGAAVNRGGYIEELIVSEDSIDTTRLDAGAVNLLRDHRHRDDPIGRVISHRIENGEAIAVVLLSESEQYRDTVNDIIRGVIRTVSVGYQPKAWEERVENEVLTIRVTRWEPWEISLTVMPADPIARIRSAVDPEDEPATPKAELVQTVASETETRSETEEDTSMTTPAEIQAAVEAERARVAGIADLATRHNLPTDFVTTHTASGTALDAVRAAALDTIATRNAAAAPAVDTTASARVTRDELETRMGAMGEAISAMMTREAPTERAREYMGMSQFDVARELLGRSARGLSNGQLIERAFEVRSGMHSTSDFAALIGQGVERTVRREYDAAPRTYAPFVNEEEHGNFLGVERLAMGDAPTLKEIKEGAEYTYGSFSDGGETYKLATYGRKISLTRQSLINTASFGMVARLVRSFGLRAAEVEADLAYAPLIGPWKMRDGKQLFHADHKNLLNVALDPTGLSAAMALMGKQTGLDGAKLELVGRTVIVGWDLAETAKKLISPISATTLGDVNIYAGSGLNLVIDQRITGNQWFLAADKNRTDTIEIAYLAGERGLQTRILDDEDRDGVTVKARLDCGSGAIDFRGLVKSAGGN